MQKRYAAPRRARRLGWVALALLAACGKGTEEGRGGPVAPAGDGPGGADSGADEGRQGRAVRSAAGPGSEAGGGAEGAPAAGSGERESGRRGAGERGWSGLSVERARPPMRTRLELATDGLPEGVAIVDLDRDGRGELVALTKTPAALHVWGALEEEPRRVALPDYPLGPLTIALGEARWLALASRSSREWILLDPLAPEPLASALRYPLDGTPRCIATCDLDEDGAPDLLCALREGRLVWIGSGGTRHEIELADAQPTCILALPGRVVVGSQGRECLRAYRLTGGELRADPASVELGGIPRALLAHRGGLVVAGGERDLWWIGASEVGARWWRANEPFDESFAALAIEPRVGAIPIDVIAAPTGESGGPETPTATTSLLRLNHGGQSYQRIDADTARLRALGAPHYAGQDPWAAALGDLDGDGLADLAIANRGASRVSVLFGDANGTYEAGENVAVGRGPHALCVADLFGDARPEIAVVGALSGTIELLAAGPDDRATRRDGSNPSQERRASVERDSDNGTGRESGDETRDEPGNELVVVSDGKSDAAPPWRVVRTLDAKPAGDSLRAGDLDRDGHADLVLVVRDDASARARVFWGDGRGGFARAERETPIGVDVADLLLHDVDGDGALELVAADAGRGEVRWLRVQGRELVAGGALTVPSVPVALCALERAGHPARSGDASTNDGGSASESPSSGPDSTDSAGARPIGAGLLAVALGEPGPRTGFAILEWRDDGLHELAHVPSDGFALDVEVAQLDGVGALELCLLVKPNQHDGPGRLRVFAPLPDAGGDDRGDAGSNRDARRGFDPRLWRLLDDQITGQRPYALAAGDYDGDGRDDLVVGAQNSHHVNLWHATPGGLRREPDLGVGRGVLDVRFVDLDGDGRADVVAANNFSNDVSVIRAR